MSMAPATTTSMDGLLADVENALRGASPGAIQALLADDRDIYRETVQERLAEGQGFCDPLGPCPDLDPSRT